MKLWELFEFDQFYNALRDGLIRTQSHPEYPLAIATYTPKAVTTDTWNQVTRQCRGLIWNTETGDIVARPFPKFFNIEENKTELAYGMDQPVVITDKLDGSLGILYNYEDQWAIATKGSFTSPQALMGTEILREKYEDFAVHSNHTFLFEIVYPENRIVLDYGDTRELFLLGAVHNEKGLTFGPDDVLGWEGPRAETFPYRTFHEWFNAEANVGRDNAEGVVVHFVRDDVRIKIKQKDYVEKHKIVFGLNERVVWEHMRDGDFDTWVNTIPEEFKTWALNVSEQLEDRSRGLHTQLLKTYDRYIVSLINGGGPDTKKRFAQWVLSQGLEKWLTGALFSFYDGDYNRHYEIIWKQVRP